MNTRRSLLVFVLFILCPPAYSTEHILMQFALLEGEQRIAAGNIYIAKNPHRWHTGLQSSYLQLHCRKNDDETVSKLYSTVNHFDGVQITHQRKDNTIELEVIRTVVTPRLTEIRALSKKQCKALSPLVATARESYRFAADSNRISYPFPGQLKFNATLKAVEHFW